MPSVEDNAQEIVRLRVELQTITAKVALQEWEISDLREWRARASLQLEGLVKADEIADAVAARMAARRAYRFTRWQRLGAAAVAVVAVGSFALDLLRAF